MCPPTSSTLFAPGCAAIPETRKVFCRSGSSGTSLDSIPRPLTQQHSEVAQILDDHYQEPDVIYLKKPIRCPVSGASAFSIAAYAKLPDALEVRANQEEQLEIPIGTKDSIECSSGRHVVDPCTSKQAPFFEINNEQATVNPDDTRRSDDLCKAPATNASSKDVPNTFGRADITTTSIHSASKVTTSAVTDHGVNINVIVDVDRKLTITYEKIPDTSTPRYIVNAPIELKIILQDPKCALNDAA